MYIRVYVISYMSKVFLRKKKKKWILNGHIAICNRSFGYAKTIIILYE